jgi:hypothetical protein
MRRVFREVGFAFLAWLLPFGAALTLSPVKRDNHLLFDSLMGVVVAATAVLLGVIYFSRDGRPSLARGIWVGLVWVVANWVMDGLMFGAGPMKMSLALYASDIGAAYLAIPIITAGLALMARSPRPTG